jgi:IS30 family transposase
MSTFTRGTQARTAEELGKHPSTISRAIRGAGSPSAPEAWQAAQRIDSENRQAMARENVQRSLHSDIQTKKG